ncbi:MAG: hypothetical protein E2600_16950 [Chryseobacterium sp.]|nr:hypothetical protein [Chryseobacterium sp.]
MKYSFSQEEMEQIKLEKQKEGREIIDHLYKLFNETHFLDFTIKKVENGYFLESEQISYLFESGLSNYDSSTLTVIQKDFPNKTFKRNEILEERNSKGGLKVSIDEFFVYIENLIK